MVEQVEDLAAKFEAHSLARKREVLDGGKVRIHKPRAGNGSARRVAECARYRSGKTGGIEPLADFRIAQAGTTGLIGAIQTVAVVLEIHTGAVVAVDHEYRETAGGSLNESHLPVANHRVNKGVDVVSEPAPFPVGQLVNHAGDEIVVEVDLRQRPVQLLPVGQGEVRGAYRSAQAVRKAVVIGARKGISHQGVNAVFRTLGLRFDLKRIVVGAALVDRGGNGGERIRSIGPVGGSSASQSVPGDGSASAGRRNVDVVAVDQDMRAARAGVANREHDVAGNFLLHIEVELLDPAQLEVGILRLEGSGKTGCVRGRRKERESIGHAQRGRCQEIG